MAGRAWVVAVLGVLGSLLVPVPASAATGDVFILQGPGSSQNPQDLQPLVKTAAGFVWRNLYTSTLWFRPTGGASAREDRLTDPTVIGDLLSSYEDGT
jgi:hypothetical protein